MPPHLVARRLLVCSAGRSGPARNRPEAACAGGSGDPREHGGSPGRRTPAPRSDRRRRGNGAPGQLLRSRTPRLARRAARRPDDHAFSVPEAGRYAVELNLAMAADYGRFRLFDKRKGCARTIEGYSPRLFWLHPRLGRLHLMKGDNILTVESLAPNPAARGGQPLWPRLRLPRQTVVLSVGGQSELTVSQLPIALM